MKESYTLEDLREWEPAGEDPPIRLGVCGHPIAHSLSPRMQNAALRDCGIAMQYGAFQISATELEEALRLFAALDFVGVNLTQPHKIAAAGLVDDLDDFARAVGAINTIAVRDGKLHGSNTDGRGFSRAIRSEFWVDLRDLRVLIIGAGGGAGRAIAWQCAQEGCERLVLVNRTPEKAQELAAELKRFFSDTRVSAPVARLEVVANDERALRFQIANIDLVVNATPLGWHRSDPPPIAQSLLAPHLMVYETAYGSTRSALLRAASEAGARAADGRDMLVHQGALAFEEWFDREAPIEAMRAALSL